MATYFSKGFGSIPIVKNPFPIYTDADFIDEGVKAGAQDAARISQSLQNQRRNQINQQREDRLAAQEAEIRANNHRTTINSWRITDTTEYDNLNLAKGNFSAKLIEVANQADVMRNKPISEGGISNSTYQSIMSELEGQIPQFKIAAEAFEQLGEKYLAGVEAGNLSNANLPEQMQPLVEILTNNASLEFQNMKNGQVKLVGTYNNEEGKKEQIEVPLSQIDRLPGVLYKPETAIKDYTDTEVGSVIEAKINDSIRKDGDGLTSLDYELIKDKKLDDIANASFTTYLDALGEGDEIKKYAQYALDTDDYTLNTVNTFIDDVTKSAIESGDKELVDKLDKGGTYEDIEAILTSKSLMNNDEGKRVPIGEAFKSRLKTKYVNDFYNQYNDALARKKGDTGKIAFTDQADEIKAFEAKEKLLKSKADIAKLTTPSPSGKESNITKFDSSLKGFTNYFIKLKGANKFEDDYSFNEKSDREKIKEIAKKLKNTPNLGNLVLGQQRIETGDDNKLERVYYNDIGDERTNFKNMDEAIKEGFYPRFVLRGQKFAPVDGITLEEVLDPKKLDEYIRNGSSLDNVNNNPKIK
tara:strand:+ start:4514 stop:6262 length:1749 start_codon:yes stop_codon:yes gene_type:complete